MIGCDLQDFTLQDWQELAYAMREQQLTRIQIACQKQLQRMPDNMQTPLVGAGIGRFLVQEIAQRLGLKYIDFETLFTSPCKLTEMNIADCAPAVAVAYLAIEAKFC
jgi:uncharacterized hydantoinase/oxoprolinase family protein